ncbi:nuclear transport factor 2 family protein [Brachybacterium hainanense]|uniref:Nuclear transport factor 2 family protein n=1 Tax=Brachybacterium hainanense TaxID=1541174 RepID=A0ABV6RDT3_9MICO
MLDELLDLEHRGWTSLCDGTGAEFYGRIMTADGAMVLAHGQIFDRRAVIDSLDEAPPWRTYEIVGPRLVRLSEDHAVLLYTGRAYRDGDAPASVALMSSVYTRRDGVWRLALYQQRPCPCSRRACPLPLAERRTPYRPIVCAGYRFHSGARPFCDGCRGDRRVR